jgi:putative oxidoreductase
MPTGLLILRCVLGITLAAHGAQKLLGWFNGPGLAGTSRGFEAIGFVPGERHAIAAGIAEIVAGLLLVTGLLTPLAAAITMSIMIVAAVTVHLPNGFFITSNGFEYNLVFGISAWTLAFTGPGAWALDSLLDWPVHGLLPGVAALGVAVTGAGLQLLQRRRPAPD